MWTSFLPAMALLLSLSAASPAPLTSTAARCQSATHTSKQAATHSCSQTPTSKTSAPTSSAVSTNARYMITHAAVSQHQGDVIPSHDTTATIIQTIEDFDIVVQGTGPGSLPVQCNATWIATQATPTNNPVGTQFSCSDPAVSALLLRQDSDPSIGWWIMIEMK